MRLYIKKIRGSLIMGKMELEVKILDIDKEKFIEKLEKMGAIFKEETKQFLYTYDLPTIYGRYIDLLIQLNNPGSLIKYETAIAKLKLLFFELDNLLEEQDKKTLRKIIDVDNFMTLCDRQNILDYLNDRKLINFVKKFHNNSKKWIRVRQTNDKVTIAVKHILAPNKTNLQQMMETEIKVSSIEDANNLLEALGFSYKSYQEKERITYLFNDYEIDIDTWPGIPTYFEIEGTSEQDLDEILNKLGYSFDESVSCTADDIYRKYGKTMFEQRELKF